MKDKEKLQLINDNLIPIPPVSGDPNAPSLPITIIPLHWKVPYRVIRSPLFFIQYVIEHYWIFAFLLFFFLKKKFLFSSLFHLMFQPSFPVSLASFQSSGSIEGTYTTQIPTPVPKSWVGQVTLGGSAYIYRYISFRIYPILQAKYSKFTLL